MSLWIYPTPLVLASASATRRTMLNAAGLPVEIIPASIDERAIDAPLRAAQTPPPDIAAALARAKAQSVSAQQGGRIVLGADQVLDCDDVMFDKALDRSEAETHLAQLQGRTHRLTSAAAVAVDGAIVFETLSEARLTMRPLDLATLSLYADQAGPVLTRSVGAYEIEGLGAHLFTHLEGDHFTIRGLPLLNILAGLRAKGWIAW